MHLAWRTSWRRKACSAVTLLAYLCATAGLPMPLAAGNPGQAAFPCQTMLCGCLTAEQCQSCGCFTPEEQAAWAAARNAAPPANAVSEENGSAGCCCDATHETPGCQHCAKKARSSCCTPKSPPAARTSCAQHASGDADAKGKKPVPWGGVSAGRCHGLALSWVTTGAAAPAAP